MAMGEGVNMKDLRNKLINIFRDKDYRHGYVDEFLNSSIATQIKVLREQRGWSQKDLADRAEMKQPRVSVMENVNYSSWNINTLRRVAEAFDLVLCVSFESFGKRLGDIEKFSRNNLERWSFDDDPVFKNDQYFSGSITLSKIREEIESSNRNANVIPISEYKARHTIGEQIGEDVKRKNVLQAAGGNSYEDNVSRKGAIRMAYENG